MFKYGWTESDQIVEDIIFPSFDLSDDQPSSQATSDESTLEPHSETDLSTGSTLEQEDMAWNKSPAQYT